MRVLFFGRLRDLAGQSEVTLPSPPATLSELRQTLAERFPELAAALGQNSISIAVDRSIVRAGEADLTGAREVAFMPPMSGG